MQLTQPNITGNLLNSSGTGGDLAGSGAVVEGVVHAAGEVPSASRAPIA
jgi:hypothetical protein